ncbi:hypothetical protein cypCar_00010140, partial [Cyprinus carpio]
SALQKGTGELLKYLRSRKQEQPDGSLKEEPKTATTLPSQAKINVHAIKTLKTQDYRILELKDNLADINLGFNKLTTIPVGFSKVKHLHLDFRALMLEGNPFRNPRAAILSKGTDAVLEYLRSRIPT